MTSVLGVHDVNIEEKNMYFYWDKTWRKDGKNILWHLEHWYGCWHLDGQVGTHVIEMKDNIYWFDFKHHKKL